MSRDEFGPGDEAKADDEFRRLLGEMDEADKDRRSRSPNKAVVLTTLKEQGIAEVVVRYDGCGDSGCIHEIEASTEDGGERTLDPTVGEMIEEYVYARLPLGWEIDGGSSGTVTFDVAGWSVSVEHSRWLTVDSAYEWEE